VNGAAFSHRNDATVPPPLRDNFHVSLNSARAYVRYVRPINRYRPRNGRDEHETLRAAESARVLQFRSDSH